MKTLIWAVVTAMVMSGSAQDWAKERLDKSPRHQEWVAVEHDGRKVQTFVVYPEVKGKAPVVLVIHEIMGMTEWVQSVADELAEAGYIALAPDLLSGLGPNGGRTTSFADLSAVREAISGLPADQVTADLNAVADYGKKLPSADGKVAVAGFCWGGSQSFRFATNRPDLSAVFVFYGTPPDDDAALARIHAPVFGFYGGNDARVTSTVPDTEKRMKAAGKKYDRKTLDGAGHGFMRAGEAPDATDANKKARTEGWKRWLSLLKSSFK